MELHHPPAEVKLLELFFRGPIILRGIHPPRSPTTNIGPTTRASDSGSRNAGKLYLSLKVAGRSGWWRIGTQRAEKPRFLSVLAHDIERPVAEIAKAKERFDLPADAAVLSCYEVITYNHPLQGWGGLQHEERRCSISRIFA